VEPAARRSAFQNPLEGLAVDLKIFALADGDHLDNHFRLDESMHDPNRFARGIKFVVAGEVEASSIAEVFA